MSETTEGCWDAWFDGLGAALARPSQPRDATHLRAPEIGRPEVPQDIGPIVMLPSFNGEVWE